MLLTVFLALRGVEHLLEDALARLNRAHWLKPENQRQAAEALGLSEADLQKSLAYAEDKFRFGRLHAWFDIVVVLVFLGLGGLGFLERGVLHFNGLAQRPIVTGLVFFSTLMLALMLLALPFEYYFVFHIEEKHGFNRQTPKTFMFDKLKALLIGAFLGGAFLAALLWVMERMGDRWWIWGWATVAGFSIFAMWIYPTLVAPLFNKFSPLPDGELKDKILRLSEQVHFKTSGLFVMDASKRSSHGNAYFTGLFGKKRIVLFDTLVNMLSIEQVVAVLAHELGHFKLHHIRWALWREIILTGVAFYLLSLCLPRREFYLAFGLQGVSSYGALAVFSLWFGLVSFLIRPVSSYLSRRNEFAADRFAVEHVGKTQTLAEALLRLREKSHALPIVHPWYSMMYYSHPPMIERIGRLRSLGA